ncbi:MAG: hypothetical protein AAGI24_04255 [Pseudomonadota bacterium]
MNGSSMHTAYLVIYCLWILGGFLMYVLVVSAFARRKQPRPPGWQIAIVVVAWPFFALLLISKRS